MKICAVLLNHFGHQETIDCVNRLMNTVIEKIIIVENSGSKEELQQLNNAFKKNRVVDILPSTRNLGFAGGVNYALKRLLPDGYDAFLLLNNDTLPPEDIIQKMLTGLKTASLDIAAPIIYRYPEMDSIWSQGTWYNTWAGLTTQRPLPLLPGNMLYLTGCCLLVTRRVFERVGLFDETFFMYGEDVDFCHRAAREGFSLGVVAKAKMYHKTSLSAVHNSLFYEYHINRSHLLLARKLFKSFSGQLFALILRLFFLGLRALIRTARFRNLNALRGYVAGLFGYQKNFQ